MISINKSLGKALLAVGAVLLFGSINGNSIVSASSADSNTVGRDSVLRLTAGELGATKNIRILPGKAVVLELPTDVRDVLIANPETMDAVVHTSTRVYLIGKGMGQTNAIFFAEDGKRLLTLNVEIGGGQFFDLEKIFKRIMPGSNIKVEAVGNTVLLTGMVKTPVQASRAGAIAKSYFSTFKFARGSAATEGKASSRSSVAEKGQTDIVNMLAVEAKEQVMLKVQMVEMRRDIVKQLGVDTEAAISNVGNLSVGVLSQPSFSALGKPLFNGVQNYYQSGGEWKALPWSSKQGISSSLSAGKYKVNNMVQAMERNGLARTLAAPNLTAISGETAKFHAGGEFPIPMPGRLGQISVKWKKFGVLLNFTPVVLSEGRISLQIKSEVSELTSEGAVTISDITIPAISVRNAESTVELPSGGSIMMAGLISEKTKQAMNGIPGLMKLPILGTLFRSRDYVKSETELVMLVTPYVVKPVAERKLQRPDAGFAPASDAKANLLGHINRLYGRRDRLPRGRQHGDYGFIVE